MHSRYRLTATPLHRPPPPTPLPPGSTGMSSVDWAVVDPIVAPPDHRDRFTERLLFMPHTYQASLSRGSAAVL